MTIRNIILVLYIVLFSTLNSYSQRDSTVSDSLNVELSDVIKMSLENNYQMKITKKNHESAKIDNTWGSSGRYPTINLGVNFGNRLDNTEIQTQGQSSRVDMTTNSISPFVSLNWVLFNGFAVITTKRNLELQEQVSEQSLVVQIETTLQDVVQSYYKVLLEKEKLTVIRQVMKLSHDRYKYVLNKKEFGSAVTFDVLQVKNAFLTDSSNYLLQKLNYENSIRGLSLMMGDSSQVFYNPTDYFAAKTDTFILSDLESKMLSSNKTLINQYLYQNILENNIKLQKSSLYPTISLSSGLDYSNRRVSYDPGSTSSSYAYDVYANLSIQYTIFSGGAKKRNIKKAKIQQDIGELQISEIKRTLRNNLISALEMYNARMQLYNVALENFESAKLNLQIAEDKFKTGAINSFNYRDIQMLYLNTSFTKLESIFNLLNSHTALMRITGGIISEYN